MVFCVLNPVSLKALYGNYFAVFSRLLDFDLPRMPSNAFKALNGFLSVFYQQSIFNFTICRGFFNQF
jgi:hypothetical protein